MMRSRIVYDNVGNRRFEIEGKEVSEAEFRERTVIAGITPGEPPMAGAPSCWPMKSEALAVHPSQIPAAMERNKRHGVTGVRYDMQGRPILADRGMRRDLMRLEGLHDNEGGYSDDHATESPQEPLSEDSTGGPIANVQSLE